MLSQNQTPRTSTCKNDVFTSQLVARYLQWWPRDIAEQSRTNGNKCNRDQETTAKIAQSWTIWHRELGLSAGRVVDCPWWRVGPSGVHTTENRPMRNSSRHNSKNSSGLSKVCLWTARSSKVTNRIAKNWFCTLLKNKRRIVQGWGVACP
jgi:hypothetical protein